MAEAVRPRQKRRKKKTKINDDKLCFDNSEDAVSQPNHIDPVDLCNTADRLTEKPETYNLPTAPVLSSFDVSKDSSSPVSELTAEPLSTNDDVATLETVNASAPCESVECNVKTQTVEADLNIENTIVSSRQNTSGNMQQVSDGIVKTAEMTGSPNEQNREITSSPNEQNREITSLVNEQNREITSALDEQNREITRVLNEQNWEMASSVNERNVQMNPTNALIWSPRQEVAGNFVSDYIKPFTEEELNCFYFNSELLELESFVREFLKNANKENHEFYDLVDFYYKARKKFIELQSKINVLQDEVDTLRRNIWEIKDCGIMVEGKCGCGETVTQHHRYQQAFFNEKETQTLHSKMVVLKGLVHEQFQLQAYSGQVGKLRIDSYIHEMFDREQSLKGITTESPTSALLPCDIDSNTISTLCLLQDCISILFGFIRKGYLEKQFNNDIDTWLDLMVVSLQRIGTLPDMFFILNHLLRCPAGVAQEKACYIQSASFNTNQLDIVWNRPQIHHFIIMLATLTLPIRAREDFLQTYHSNQKVDFKRNISWTLVDENKYEDENNEEYWSLMAEGDLVAVFNQFPFTQLLGSLLYTDVINGELVHSPSKSTSNDILSLLAYSSLLVKLLGQIFETYSMLRYSRFVKHVSIIIRLVTLVVSDHWMSYRKYCTEVVGDRFHDLPKTNTYNGYSLARLQTEFDQFLLRAAYKMIASKCSGVMQFLSTMPFEAASLSAMWTLLHVIIDKQSDYLLVTTKKPSDLPSIIDMQVSPTEGIFMLTVLGNMAVARDDVDKLLIETTTKLIIELAFLNPSLEDLYSKNAQDLLVTVALKHPFVISTLIRELRKSFLFQKHMLFIFQHLPLELWQPCPEDFDVLRSWLMECSLQSEENKLARFVLSGINYNTGYVESELFIPRHYHYLVAILIVESYGVNFPNNPGGIQSYSSMGIIEQASKLAVSSYNKIVYSQLHTEYWRWAWQVMLMLKLHQSDTLQNRIEEIPTDKKSYSWSYSLLYHLQNQNPYELDLETTAVLINVLRASESYGLLASYVAFAMTKYGHLLDVFLSRGSVYLTRLCEAGEHNAVLRMVSNISNLFAQLPDRLCTQSFMKVMLTLIHIDVGQAGYTEKLWQYFVLGTYSQSLASLLTAHITKLKETSALTAIRYWLYMLVNIPAWYRDCSVLYQMDVLCKVAFTVQNGMEVICGVLLEEYHKFILSREPRGLLSSVMSLISNNQIISFMPNVNGSFCYYAYAILAMETEYEEDIGLWNEMAIDLIMRPSLTVIQSHKKACASLKAVYKPPLQALSIYRWAEQALVTPEDHSCLALIWQNFFMIFLRKPTEHSGLPGRSGIGLRFFESSTSLSAAKNMKSSLYTVANYHKEKGNHEKTEHSSMDCRAEKERECSSGLHKKLSAYYHGLALWLEESRLHDANLYLNSLPPVYNPDFLLRIFQGNRDLWVEYLNMDCLEMELHVLSTSWNETVYKACEEQPIKAPLQEVLIQATASNRIVKRLQRECAPLPPPQVLKPTPPYTQLSYHVLLTRPRLVLEITSDLEAVVELAKIGAAAEAKHTALDCKYLEMVVDLYEMVDRKILMGIPCDGKKKKRAGGCTKPAEVMTQFKELRLREQTYCTLEDNRDAFHRLISSSLKDLPVSLCKSVVRVECIIQMLCDGFDTLQESQRISLQESARKLFYLFAQLIDHDVKRSAPAIQFFSSAVETLGKKFIADNFAEQMPLLDTVLSQHASVVFLAPHFFPMQNLDNYENMYDKIARAINREASATVFVLLSKFDLCEWLSTNPAKSRRGDLVAHIMEALKCLGLEPDSELSVVLELVVSHLTVMLKRDFSEHFSKVLIEMLSASAALSMHALCWREIVELLHAHKHALHATQIKEALSFLAEYFCNVIQEHRSHLDPFYEKWQLYIGYIMAVFEMLVEAYIKLGCYIDVNDAWHTVVSLYHPWLVPRSPTLVWSLLRTDDVLVVLRTFIGSVRLLTEISHNVILASLWNLYFQAVVPAVREEQSLDLFHSVLVTLPWSHFTPGCEELTNVLQAHCSHMSAFRFLSHLCCDVNWHEIFTRHVQDSNAISQLFLSILLMMAADDMTVTMHASKLEGLLETAQSFNWDCLMVDETARTCQWYAENVLAPLAILNESSFVWHVMGFLQSVCGFNKKQPSDDFVIAKRNIYLQVLTTILARCSNSGDRSHDFRFPVNHIVQMLECIITSDISMHELVMHCSTALHLLNSITCQPVFQVIRSTFEDYLQATHSRMLVLSFVSAASRSIASLQHMVSFLEIAIFTYFSKLRDDELQDSWAAIMRAFVVPELNKEDFVQEALKQKALLSLYSYNLHAIPLACSQNVKLSLLADAVQWCSKTLPTDTDCEVKLALLWLQIFDLVRMQAPFYEHKNQFQQLTKYMIYLAMSSQMQGEDKTYTGVLGALGIGKRSPLTKGFRVSAKAVNVFLLCQIPTMGATIRCHANAPGAVRQQKTCGGTATVEAEKAFSSFQGLLKNKNYADVKAQVQWVVDFVGDPAISLNDGCTLVAYLCQQFFDKYNYITATIA